MNTRRSLIGALGLAAVLITAALPGYAGGRWLHVRVQDGDEVGENVSINLPFESVAGFLPLLEQGQFEGRFSFGDDGDEVQLRAVLAGLRDAPDGEFLKVQGHGESARVAKENGFLLILVEDHGEQVRIRLPLVVVEALLGDETDGLDLAAGLRALERFNGKDLVTVDGDRGKVRIWIDASEGGD